MKSCVSIAPYDDESSSVIPQNTCESSCILRTRHRGVNRRRDARVGTIPLSKEKFLRDIYIYKNLESELCQDCHCLRHYNSLNILHHI